MLRHPLANLVKNTHLLRSKLVGGGGNHDWLTCLEKKTGRKHLRTLWYTSPAGIPTVDGSEIPIPTTLQTGLLRWVMLDLGAARTVTEVRLYAPSAGFQVQVSTLPWPTQGNSTLCPVSKAVRCLKKLTKTGWWFQRCFIFTLGGNDPVWWAYFLDGWLKPPTREWSFYSFHMI